MTRFVNFEETNDHEGETWRHWLQLDGNEAELGRLDEALRAWEDVEEAECEYRLDLDHPVPEYDVDVLVRHTGSGYMAYDTKVAGALAVPEDLLTHTGDYDQFDRLYKGGIRRLFTAPNDAPRTDG